MVSKIVTVIFWIFTTEILPVKSTEDWFERATGTSYLHQSIKRSVNQSVSQTVNQSSVMLLAHGEILSRAYLKILTEEKNKRFKARISYT